jgi:beta-ureidopropionase
MQLGWAGGMIQNRGHAQFNSLYMICPNVGPVYLHPKMRHPVDIAGGNSHIVDYYGNIMSYSASGSNTMVAAILDIEALRNFRLLNLNSNWMKDLRTEVFRRMYEQPIHPKNLWMEQDPLTHEPVDDIYRSNIQKLVARGAFTPPSNSFPGAFYQGEATTPEAWEEIKHFWDGWGEDEG